MESDTMDDELGLDRMVAFADKLDTKTIEFVIDLLTAVMMKKR